MYWKAIVDLYERHAQDFDRDRSRSLQEKAWLDRFLGHVRTSGVVLDIGCGMAEPIARYILQAGFHVVGIDSSPALVRTAVSRSITEVSILQSMSNSFSRMGLTCSHTARMIQSVVNTPCGWRSTEAVRGTVRANKGHGADGTDNASRLMPGRPRSLFQSEVLEFIDEQQSMPDCWRRVRLALPASAQPDARIPLSFSLRLVGPARLF